MMQKPWMSESRFPKEKKMSNLWTFPLMTPLMTDQIRWSDQQTLIFTSSKINNKNVIIPKTHWLVPFLAKVDFKVGCEPPIKQFWLL